MKESGSEEPCFYPCQGNSIWLQSDQDGRMEGSPKVRLNVFLGKVNQDEASREPVSQEAGGQHHWKEDSSDFMGFGHQ